MLGTRAQIVSPGLGRGSRSSGGDRGRSQPRPEARGAGADHPRSAERLNVAEVARRAGLGRPAVWRLWRAARRSDPLERPGDGATHRRLLALGAVSPWGIELQAALNRSIAEHDDDPKPFTWTKTPTQILTP